VPISFSQGSEISNTTGLVPELPGGSEGAAQLITQLERRVQVLEARVQRCEAERDDLAVAYHDARDAQRDAEAAAGAQEAILSVVAHDLRNPLGTIVMAATTLLQLPVEPVADLGPQRVRAVAERLYRQSARMVQQIANLSDFVEIRTGRIALDRAMHAPCAILSAASEVLGSFARERGIAFEVHTMADAPEVDCDLDRVVRALSNLVGNAIRVTPRGEAVELGARPTGHGHMVFFVRDHGPGISSNEQARLFRPFAGSRQPCDPGVWLGFAIARGIVEAHGGRIWIDSAPGAGTKVSFSLTPDN
jgi:signal transduction histidine kinase